MDQNGADFNRVGISLSVYCLSTDLLFPEAERSKERCDREEEVFWLSR